MPEQDPPRRSVVWNVLVAGVVAFLWIFPTFSAVFLVNQEPALITITSCTSHRKDFTGQCQGEWRLADGSTGNGIVTEYREELERGDVLDGVYIDGRAALSPLPWILDVALMYPAALGLTVRIVVLARRRRRTRFAVAAAAATAGLDAAGVGRGRAAGVEPEVDRVRPGDEAARPGTRPRSAGERITNAAILAGVFALYAFLWGFPTYSVFAVATADPVAITVGDCTGNRCHGEWTAPDGSPADGSIEIYSTGVEDGDVIEGMVIDGRTVEVPLPWILDMVFLYPLALLVTVGPLVMWLRRRRRGEDGDASGDGSPDGSPGLPDGSPGSPGSPGGSPGSPDAVGA